MKINGREPKGPNIEFLVIPRPEGDFVFKAQAILKFDEFHHYIQRPKVRDMITNTGERIPDLDDPIYKAQIDDYSTKRTDYMVIKSLEATEGLEWDNVKLEDPNTWSKWRDDLSAAGFNEYEETRLVQLVMSVNSLNDSKLDEARKRFLVSQVRPVVS